MEVCRRNILVFVYLLYSVCITNTCSCDETRPMVLFRFKRVSSHYETHMEKDYDIKSDPLNLLYRSPDDRQALCDAVLDAKQFATADDRRKESFLNDLTKLHRPSESTSSGHSDIRVENCPINQRWGYRVVKCLLCVKLKRERWFVAFGRLNQFMYLLRQDEFIPPSNSRLMGLLEYSAIITKENSSFLYFHHHFQRRKARMESICDSSTEDRLRLCSLVFVALSDKEIPRMCTVDIHRGCHHTVVRGGKSLSTKAKVLACTIFSKQSNTLLMDFFVLPDVVEGDAAFVFLAVPNTKEERLPVLRFHARVVRATSLLTPIKPDERPSTRKTAKREKQKKQTELCKKRPAKNKFLISETTRKRDEDETDTDSSVTPDDDEWRSVESDDEEESINKEEKLNETVAGPSSVAPDDDDDEWRHERESDFHQTSAEDECRPDEKRKKLDDISSSEFKFFADTMNVPMVREEFAVPAEIVDCETDESDGRSPVDDDGVRYEKEIDPRNNAESERESSKGDSSASRET